MAMGRDLYKNDSEHSPRFITVDQSLGLRKSMYDYHICVSPIKTIDT